MVDGEAGIGKTTVWLAALQQARDLGFRVLSTRATSAESVLAYSSLAGLLEGLEDDVFAMLPPPQRVAIDRVLLRVNADGPVTDQRAVAAAFLSVLERLAEDRPVLVGIDDLQWLDLTSAQVISSAVRRLSGAVGVLATLRTDAGTDESKMTLELREPNRLRRIRVPPLSVGALHKLSLALFGAGNPNPVFRASGVEVIDGPRLLKERHLKMAFKQDGRVLRGIAWRAAEREVFVTAHRDGIDLAFSLEQDTWNGERYLQFLDRRFPRARELTPYCTTSRDLRNATAAPPRRGSATPTSVLSARIRIDCVSPW